MIRQRKTVIRELNTRGADTRGGWLVSSEHGATTLPTACDALAYVRECDAQDAEQRGVSTVREIEWQPASAVGRSVVKILNGGAI